MDKGKVHDLLIKKVAIKTLTPESIVEKIISFQGKDANRHARDNDEIEFSGFGKFMRSQNKTKKKVLSMEVMLGKLEAQSLSEEGELLLATMKKINHIKESLEYHKTKIHEQVEGVDQSDPRGSEES